MDYGKVLDSSYKWISVKGAWWFLVFFWITIAILSVVPLMLKQGIFFDAPSLPVVQTLFAFNMLVLFIGFFALIEFILKANNFKTPKVTPGKLLDSLFLVVLCAWYVFMWNMERKHRLVQLLSLFALAFSMFARYYFHNLGVDAAVLVFGIIYLGFVIRNCVRLSFGYFIFYNRRLSIKHALAESWKISEHRVFEILLAFIIGGVTIGVIGAVIVFVIASLSSGFFIDKYAIMLGTLVAMAPMIIGEQAFIAEVYSQIEIKHAIKKKVNNILVRRTLGKVKKAKPKKKAVKKAAKKKTTKKKVAASARKGVKKKAKKKAKKAVKKKKK